LPAGGRINIQTRNVELAEKSQDRNVQLAPGAYVMVEIADNGAGIPEEVLPRVFEPFFTTKRGNHRGLGLAWVYGVVTNHGGGVAISSRISAGTSVRIYLPAEKRIVADNGLAGEDLKGQETVLIVDDEDQVLTLGQIILSAYGYRVLTANSGQKALDVLGAKESIDLVITDLVMPVMSGRELIQHIRNLTPDVRILCTSGYVWSGGQAVHGPRPPAEGEAGAGELVLSGDPKGTKGRAARISTVAGIILQTSSFPLFSYVPSPDSAQATGLIVHS